MRLLLVAALLMTPACLTECDGVGAIGSMRQGDMQHGAARGGMAVPVDGEDVPVSYYWNASFLVENHALPTCTAAVGCVMQCSVSTGTTWSCVDGDGAAIAVTQGTAPTAETLPYDAESLTDITAAKAPSLAGSVADTLGSVWTAPHTVMWQGHSTELTSASFQYLFSHESTGRGLGIRSEGNTFRCMWNGGAPVRTSAGIVENGWAQIACRKRLSGASSEYDSWADGKIATTASATDPLAPTGSPSLWFGRRTATDFPLRGSLSVVTVYDEAKSDAFLDEEAARFNAALVDGVALIHPDSSDAAYGFGNTLVDADGYYVDLYGAQHRVDVRGLYIEEGRANVWAANALDVNSWTNVGTPVVTSNTACGPFCRKGLTAEADTLEDNDAAAFEGKRSGSLGTHTGKATASCIMQPGTTDKVRLVIDTNGTGDATCDLDVDLDCEAEPLTGWYRCSCSTTITGSPTATTADILVGNDAADTGTLIISQCQLDNVGWPSSPKATSGSRGTTEADVTDISAWFGGDINNGGSVEVVFALDYDDADRNSNTDASYLVDISDGADHGLLIYRILTGSGACEANKICVQHYNAGCAAADYTSLSTNTVSLSKDTYYAIKYAWQPTSTTQSTQIYFDACPGNDPVGCAATTLVGSHTGKCQTDVVPDRADLGMRYNSLYVMDGHLHAVRVGDR